MAAKPETREERGEDATVADAEATEAQLLDAAEGRELEADEAEQVEAEESTPAPTLVTKRLFVPLPPQPPRRRRGPSLAVPFALCAYLGAILVAVNLAAPARDVSLDWLPTFGAGSAGGSGLVDTGGPDALALRTHAARAQQSTAVVDTRFGQATGFVAWVIKGESYVITALPAVQALVDAEEADVFVRRGQRFWRGTIERVDVENQLALVLVPAEVGPPLWQQRHDSVLEEGSMAAIVRAGNIGSVQGRVTDVAESRATVTAEGDPMNLGAPVIGPGGRLVGVVAGGGSGTARVVPLERACGEIRRCA